jgi:hypothetical protein
MGTQKKMEAAVAAYVRRLGRKENTNARDA